MVIIKYPWQSFGIPPWQLRSSILLSCGVNVANHKVLGDLLHILITEESVEAKLVCRSHLKQHRVLDQKVVPGSTFLQQTQHDIIWQGTALANHEHASVHFPVSLVRETTHPHQCSPLCCFNTGQMSVCLNEGLQIYDGDFIHGFI